MKKTCSLCDTDDWDRHQSDLSIQTSPELLQDFEKFKDLILYHTGLDLSKYKAKQTYRRVWSMVARANCKRFTDYFLTLQRDDAHLQEFVDKLTINVSELFRDPDRFEALRQRVLPELLARRKVLSIWSAGCSFGAEAYSLAILLHEAAPDRPHSILCTDVNKASIEQAQKGFFEDADLENVPETLRNTYFRTCSHRGSIVNEAAPFLQQYLDFRVHDLLTEPYPIGFDLIVCRNVVIYFVEEERNQVYRRLYDALLPGGCLFVGSSERIFYHKEVGFAYLEPGFYQKPVQMPVLPGKTSLDVPSPSRCSKSPAFSAGAQKTTTELPII